MASSKRYGQSVYLPDFEGGRAERLHRLRLSVDRDGSAYDEAWLQKLLFETPEILPIGEIDPSYAPAVPLCREMPTPAGPIDIAYINENGMLTLVECKLWRNPQARRDAVSQILDYAKEVGRWTYDDLSAAVGRALGQKGNVPFDLLKAQAKELDEATFIDDTARNLAHGRFLLVIVGDGIRENVEHIAEYLQQYAGLHFTFALVELAIYDMPKNSPGGVIVQPHVLAKTVEIERAVVRLADSGLRVDMPEIEETKTSARKRKSKITEEDFFDQISDVDKDLPRRIKSFFAECEAIGLTITHSRASMILHWHYDDWGTFNFGTFFPSGQFQTNYIVSATYEGGDEKIGVSYLEGLAALIPGAWVKTDGDYWCWHVVVGRSFPEIGAALQRADDWVTLIQKAMDDLRAFRALEDE